MILDKSIPHEIIPLFIIKVPDHLKTQETCNEAVRIGLYSLAYVPDWYKTQEICNGAVREYPWSLQFVPGHFKTKKMCKEAVEEG